MTTSMGGRSAPAPLRRTDCGLACAVRYCSLPASECAIELGEFYQVKGLIEVRPSVLDIVLCHQHEVALLHWLPDPAYDLKFADDDQD